MSQAVRIALVARLVADAALVALLAKDPADGVSPALFAGRKTLAPPVYNCLTYRLQSSAPDSRFRPALPGTGAASVEALTFEAEAWTRDPDSGPIDAILARLSALLDNAAFDVGADGRIYKTEALLSEPDLYDDKLNAWFGLFRARLRLQK